MLVSRAVPVPVDAEVRIVLHLIIRPQTGMPEAVHANGEGNQPVWSSPTRERLPFFDRRRIVSRQSGQYRLPRSHDGQRKNVRRHKGLPQETCRTETMSPRRPPNAGQRAASRATRGPSDRHPMRTTEGSEDCDSGPSCFFGRRAILLGLCRAANSRIGA